MQHWPGAGDRVEQLSKLWKSPIVSSGRIASFVPDHGSHRLHQATVTGFGWPINGPRAPNPRSVSTPERLTGSTDYAAHRGPTAPGLRASNNGPNVTLSDCGDGGYSMKRSPCWPRGGSLGGGVWVRTKSVLEWGQGWTVAARITCPRSGLTRHERCRFYVCTCPATLGLDTVIKLEWCWILCKLSRATIQLLFKQHTSAPCLRAQDLRVAYWAQADKFQFITYYNFTVEAI